MHRQRLRGPGCSGSERVAGIHGENQHERQPLLRGPAIRYQTVRRILTMVSISFAGLLLAGGSSAAAIGHCMRSAYAPRQVLPAILVIDVHRMTCTQGVRVMRRVAPALSQNYYDRLGSTRNRRIRGYRCSGYLVGDASWRITCRRERQSVTGLTAE